MRAAVLAAALALSACGSMDGTVRDGDPRDEIAALTTFTIADLQSARDLAQSADDKIAVMCWTDLLASAERLQAVAARCGEASTTMRRLGLALVAVVAAQYWG